VKKERNEIEAFFFWSGKGKREGGSRGLRRIRFLNFLGGKGWRRGIETAKREGKNEVSQDKSRGTLDGKGIKKAGR